MSAKVPDQTALGERPTPRPSGGFAQYRVDADSLLAPAQATFRLGQTLEGEGDKLFAKFQIEEERADNVRVQDAINQLKTKTLDMEIGEQNGYKRLVGGAAASRPLLPEYTKRYEDAVEQIKGALATDRQKEKFMLHQAPVGLGLKEGLLRHMVEQGNVYADHVFQNAVKTSAATVAANPLNSLIAESESKRVDSIIKDQVERKGYRGKEAEEAFQLERNNVVDKMWTARIDALLYTQPMVADALFRANEKAITNPELKLVLQAKVREASTGVSATVEAQRVVDEVRSMAPPAAAPTIEVGTGPRSIRNNNPGNIEKSATKWAGEVEGADPRFVTFATREDGLRAMQQNLLAYQDKHGLKTVEGIIGRWAPAKENGEASTRNYVKTVAAALGVKPGDDINLRDPTMMAAMTQAMAQVEAGGSSEPRAGAGGMRKVSSPDPETQNTTGMPTSRDVAAQLPFMMLRVEKRANELYGTDQGNPDRAAFIKRMSMEIHSKVAADVQQLNALQRQAQGILIDAIAGQGVPGAGGMVKAGGKATMLTAFSQIQENPELMRQWQMLDPGVKPAMLQLIQKNMEVGKPGDETLYRSLFNRIHLEPGDPKKIEFYKQITDPAVADRLSMQQIRELRLEIDRAETPGGRSPNQMRKAADTMVATWFKTNIMFTAQPDRQIAATNRWNEVVGRRIDEYVKAGTPEKVRAMFQTDSPESVVPGGKAGNAFLQSFVDSTPAQGVAQGAAAVASGAQPQVAPAVQPTTIKTRAELDAWFATLPDNVKTFTGTDGQVRMVPARAAAAPAAAGAVAPTADAKPAAVMNEAGKIVAPVIAPAPKKDPDALPVFRAQAGLSPEEQEQHLGGLWAAAKAMANAAFNLEPAGRAIAGGVSGLVNAVIGHSQEFRETETKAMFRHLLTKNEFTPLDVPVVRAAVKYGNLDPGDLKKAKAMLKAAEAK